MRKYWVMLSLVVIIAIGVAYGTLPLSLTPGFREVTGSGPYSTPRWSPDGTKVIFESSQPGIFSQIHVLEVNSGVETQITPEKGMQAMPDWSPDGRQIAYSSSVDGQYQIFVMNADGTDARQLTHLTDSATYPKWSPNGKYIAFSRIPGKDLHQSEISLMDVDGGNISQLTHYPLGGIASFEWSRDGNQIVFGAERVDEMDQGLGGYGPYLYVIKADGSGMRQIDVGGSAFVDPTWAPKGKQILADIQYLRPSDFLKDGFYLIDLDSSNRQVLLQEACKQPNWSASRNEIVFVCGNLMGGIGSIYIADARSIVH